MGRAVPERPAASAQQGARVPAARPAAPPASPARPPPALRAPESPAQVGRERGRGGREAGEGSAGQGGVTLDRPVPGPCQARGGSRSPARELGRWGAVAPFGGRAAGAVPAFTAGEGNGDRGAGGASVSVRL